MNNHKSISEQMMEGFDAKRMDRCQSNDGTCMVPEDADTYMPGDELGVNENPVRQAIARHNRVARAKASIQATIKVDQDGLRNISIEQLIAVVNDLDVVSLRDLVLDHIYHGGSFT